MTKYEAQKSDDGNCPYCDSDFKMRISRPGPKAIPPQIAEGSCTYWKCFRCNKDFYCIEG